MNVDALSPVQQTTLEIAVDGSKLVDFGGGDGTLAVWLLQHGAEKALVIDKEKRVGSKKHANLSYIFCYFKDIKEPLTEYDTAVICWPTNTEESTRELNYRLFAFKRIIYIGRCDEVNMCGTPTLWKYLSTRKLETVVDGYPHCVIIYGDYGRDLAKQPLVREEKAGLHVEDGLTLKPKEESHE